MKALVLNALGQGFDFEEVAQEEIFGPVLSVIAYDSDDDAIRIANDSKYGLHAAVLGTDLSRARRVASQLRAGRVVINGMTDDPQAPWGGFKCCGVGREYGQYGIEASFEQFGAFSQDAVDNKALLAKGGKITMRVFAIGAEKFFGKGMADEMRFAASNVTGGIVPNSGHWIMEENPQATIKLVTDFLAK